MATETVAYIANEAFSQWEQACEHPLEMEAKARAADDSGERRAKV